MSIFTWIAKPVTKEIVKQAMKTFFDDYATKALAFIAVVFLGVAFLMGKATIEQFMTVALSSAGIVGARSIGHAIATKQNHSQGVSGNAPSNGNGL